MSRVKQNKKSKNRPINMWSTNLKTVQWKKDSVFNKWCWSSCLPRAKKKELPHVFHIIYKINFRYTIELSENLKVHIFEENIGKSPDDWFMQRLLRNKTKSFSSIFKTSALQKTILREWKKATD